MNRYTTQRALRIGFWREHAACGLTRQRKAGGHNAQNATVRSAFCNWVDALARSGSISESLAQRATLG